MNTQIDLINPSVPQIGLLDTDTNRVLAIFEPTATAIEQHYIVETINGHGATLATIEDYKRTITRLNLELAELRK